MCEKKWREATHWDVSSKNDWILIPSIHFSFAWIKQCEDFVLDFCFTDYRKLIIKSTFSNKWQEGEWMKKSDVKKGENKLFIHFLHKNQCLVWRKKYFCFFCCVNLHLNIFCYPRQSFAIQNNNNKVNITQYGVQSCWNQKVNKIETMNEKKWAESNIHKEIV